MILQTKSTKTFNFGLKNNELFIIIKIWLKPFFVVALPRQLKQTAIDISNF